MLTPKKVTVADDFRQPLSSDFSDHLYKVEFRAKKVRFRLILLSYTLYVLCLK